MDLLERTILGGLVIFGLTSCSPSVTLWYQTNAAPGAGDREALNCRISATQQVPVNTQVGQNPTYVTPTTTDCYRRGRYVQCIESGGEVVGGDYFSFDANADLRSQFVQQCMGQKGFDLVTLRQCKEKDLKAGLPTYRVLPQLQENACVTQAPGSSKFLFVNPPSS